MKNWEEDIDQLLSQGLRNRLDGSEAPVDDVLYKRIRRKLARSGRNMVLPVMLVLLVTGFLSWRYTARSSTETPKATIGNNAQTLATARPDAQQSGRAKEHNQARESSHPFFPERVSTIHQQKSRKGFSTSQKAFITAVSETSRQNTPVIQHQIQPEVFSVDNNADSGFTVKHFQIGQIKSLKSLAYTSRQPLKMPAVESPNVQYPPIASKSRISWIVGVSPMQNFQSLRVHSGPLHNYQGIRFPSLLSLQAKTIQISAGAELKGFRLLAHYAYSQNRIFYQHGTGSYDIKPVLNGASNIMEITTNEVLDEEFHRIGLGVYKIIAPRSGLFRNYELSIGAQYDRILQQKQGTFWANAGVLRQVHLSKNSQLAIGPYAQTGLNDQKTRIPGWQYKALQIGLSAALKVNTFQHKN